MCSLQARQYWLAHSSSLSTSQIVHDTLAVIGVMYVFIVAVVILAKPFQQLFGLPGQVGPAILWIVPACYQMSLVLSLCYLIDVQVSKMEQRLEKQFDSLETTVGSVAMRAFPLTWMHHTNTGLPSAAVRAPLAAACRTCTRA